MEKDIQSSVVILFSKDYEKFKILMGNRSIIPKKIKKLKDSILNGLDLLKYCPIIVNEKWEILDGQHRFEVSKELGKPIFYVIRKEETHVKQVAEMNNNTDKWKSKDYVDCFEKQGNENYKKLNNLIGNYKMTYSSASSLLLYGHPGDGGGAMIHVKTGTFKVKYEDHVINFLKWIKPLNEHVQNIQSRDYLSARMFLFNQKDKSIFNIELLINKIKASGEKLPHCLSRKLYMSKIEDIYNFKNKIRVRIY